MKVETMTFSSTFFEYLCGFIWFDHDRLEALMKRYPIGATEKGEPIFWHINAGHKITNGRILTMDGNSGKVYDDSWYYHDGRPMCLFGEHLLDTLPSQTVALVKDEMTAAIMSCFPTPYVWLATGKANVTPTDLHPLEGRTVVVFPDKGEHDRWQDMIRMIPNLQFHVSDVMEKSQGDCHTIAQMMLSQQPLCPTEEEAALMRMEDANPNIALLVKVLGLEVVSIAPINDKAKDEAPKSEHVPEDPKEYAAIQSILSAQEQRWHGRNLKCHKCPLSHEGINGTYCGKLHRYVEYGKGDCGETTEPSPAPD